MPQVKPVSSATPLYFTEGGNGVPPTWPGPDWFNIFQTELLNILKEAGINPDKANHAQLLAAMKKLLLSRSNPFGDIKADGPAAIATALANLRLGAGAPPIGIPFFWPSAAMPNTVMDEWSDMVFLKFNGATFSATTYPKLALVIPSLKLTDARGAFPRILDDGRGVDNGRVLLSEQLDAMQNVTGSLSDNTMGSASSASGVFRVDSGSGVKYAAPSVGNAFGYYGVTFDLSRIARTSEETRPRNIAFNFLVRAK
ncbi:TPA: integrase [Citrobacter freundii]|nr:integrase [Citrobacter freundii]